MSDKKVVIDDDGEISQSRVRDIFSSRREVQQVRNEVKKAKIEAINYDSTEEADRQARSVYRGHIETYFTEIEPLFLATEEGQHLWANEDFGTLTLRPPIVQTANGYELETGNKRKEIRGQPPEGRAIPIEGLSSVFNVPSPASVTWTIPLTKTVGFGRIKYNEEAVTVQRELSMKTLDQMLRTANTYLSSIGLEADLDESKPPEQVENADL